MNKDKLQFGLSDIIVFFGFYLYISHFDISLRFSIYFLLFVVPFFGLFGHNTFLSRTHTTARPYARQFVILSCLLLSFLSFRCHALASHIHTTAIYEVHETFLFIFAYIFYVLIIIHFGEDVIRASCDFG